MMEANKGEDLKLLTILLIGIEYILFGVFPLLMALVAGIIAPITAIKVLFYSSSFAMLALLCIFAIEKLGGEEE